MGNLRFLGLVACMVLAAFFGMRWLVAAPAVTPDAPLPLQRADPNEQRPNSDQSSFTSDDDSRRDVLRQAVLETAKLFGDNPGDAAMKARYAAAATDYARAWLSIAPCVGTMTCCPSDGPRLDRAKKAFGTPRDRRVRDAMRKAHATGGLSSADFPGDAVALVAEMAGDPAINAVAITKAKQMAASSMNPARCPQ